MEIKKTFVVLIFLIIFLSGCNLFTNNQTYTLQFDTNGGTNVDTITNIEKGTKLSLPTPTKENYEFKGWYLYEQNTEINIDDNTEILGDWTLYARWEIKKYTVVFMDFNDMIFEIQTVEHGKAAIAPPNPTRMVILLVDGIVNFLI